MFCFPLTRDAAIDACDHLQNLRSAIYDYKLRRAVYNEADKAYAHLTAIGTNYLVRYFYLIVFACYLMEMRHTAKTQAAPQTQEATVKMAEPFSLWLSHRREIQNLLQSTEDATIFD